MNTSTPYQAHISHNGQLSLDAEPQVVPEGIDPSQVLQQVLHIQAAGSGTPVQVHVRDDRTGSGFDIEVLPDGTTRPPARTTRPRAPKHRPRPPRTAWPCAWLRRTRLDGHTTSTPPSPQQTPLSRNSPSSMARQRRRH